MGVCDEVCCRREHHHGREHHHLPYPPPPQTGLCAGRIDFVSRLLPPPPLFPLCPGQGWSFVHGTVSGSSISYHMASIPEEDTERYYTVKVPVSNADHDPTPSKFEYCRARLHSEHALGPVHGVIRLVDDPKHLAEVENIILRSSVVGIDAEWKPDGGEGGATLVQLAVLGASSFKFSTPLLDARGTWNRREAYISKDGCSCRRFDSIGS